MTQVTIRMRDVPDTLRQALAKNRRAILRGIERTVAVDAHRHIQAAIRDSSPVPVDTGDYKASWRHEMFEDGGMIYSAASPALKAGVIEYGRRPGWIPIAPLADWVRRKLGISDPKEARSIAFLISRKASTQRRPGLKVLERAHPEILKALLRNVDRELRTEA